MLGLIGKQKKQMLDLEFSYLITKENMIFQNETRLLTLDRILKCKLKKTPVSGNVDFSLPSLENVISCTYDLKVEGNKITLTVDYGKKEIICLSYDKEINFVDVSSKSFEPTDIGEIYEANQKQIYSLIKRGCDVHELFNMFTTGTKISVYELGLDYSILPNGNTRISVSDYLKEERSSYWLSKGLTISDIEKYLNNPWNKKIVLKNMIVSNSKLNDNYKGYVLKEEKMNFSKQKTLI